MLKIKSLISNKVLLTLLVVFTSTFFVLALDLGNLYGSDVTAIKGAQEVPFPIYLDNNHSVAGIQLEVDYPSDLVLQDIQGTVRMTNATIIFNDNSAGHVNITALVNNHNALIEVGNGAILNLIFDVNSEADLGVNTINLNDVLVAGLETIPLSSNFENGSFTIVYPYNITFLPPITNFDNFTLQDGATLPFKFKVEDSMGFVNDTSVLVRIYNSTLGIDKTYNASGEGSDYLDIDIDEEQYKININTYTLSMPIGAYDIEVEFSQFQKEMIGFELIQQGPTNGKGKGKQK